MATAKKKAAPAASGKTYKTKRVVTVPVLKWTLEEPVHVRIESKMFKGSAQKATPGKQAMEPATLVHVTNLDTGEVTQIILGATLVSILNETYEKDSYLGKSFRFIKHEKKDGKRYYTFTVEEIEA